MQEVERSTLDERETVRARSDVAIECVAWSIVAVACLQLVLYGYGRDQGVYGVIADGILAGRMPYRDVWDIKPPGIFVIFAAANAVFGRHMASIRLVEAAGMVAMVFGFRTVARAAALPVAAGVVGGALAVLANVELGFWHTSQSESFAGVFTVCALALAARVWQRIDAPATRRDRLTSVPMLSALFGIGVLGGAAFLLKPHLAVGPLACTLVLSIAMWRRTRSAGKASLPWAMSGLGALLPIAALVVWFVARGAWPALHWTLFDYTPSYSRLSWKYDPFVLLGVAWLLLFYVCTFVVPAGVIAAMKLPPLSSAEPRLGRLLFAIVALHMFAIAAQAKFIGYHWAASLPLVAFIAGIGIYKVWRKVRVYGPLAVLLFATALVALDVARTPLYQKLDLELPEVEHFWPRSWDRMVSLVTGSPSREELDAKLYRLEDSALDDNRTVGREVARRTKPDDFVFVWGFEPAVYWFAERQPATRFITNQAQRAKHEQAALRAELMQDLRAHTPRVIVVQHEDVMPHVTGDDLDSSGALATFPELRSFLATRYRYVESLRDFDIYELS